MIKVLKSVISVGFAAALVCSMDTTAYAKSNTKTTKTTVVTTVVTTVKTTIASKQASSNSGTVSLMSSGSLTGLLPWYENTGTTIPEGYTPDYTQYNLLETAQIGDIIYETDWYCTELVWAAYYNQGIDVETTGWLNEPRITPRDIYRSSKVTEIDFK